MSLDVLAGEGHFVDHLVPVWRAMDPALRGAFLVLPELVEHAKRAGVDAIAVQGGRSRRTGPVLVASWGDLKRARHAGRYAIAFIEHGAGQSYGGQRHTDDDRCAHCHPSYSGGRDRADVELTLVPNDHAAARWRAVYPAMDVRVVGCPKLDTLPRRGRGAGPVVAMSFHHNANNGCPEGNSAFHHFRAAIPVLAAQGFTLIGHAHPRHARRIEVAFERAGVEFVPHFAEVCRRADLYMTDNSSTLFEFAATGRPVVVLNSPEYRRRIRHGLRFWDAATVGIQADGPAGPTWTRADHQRLVAIVELALADPPEQRRARQAALRLVYRYRTGGARRAAAALADWVAGIEAAAA